MGCFLQLSPLHALAGTIALEDQQPVYLVAIQTLDRVVQTLFGILVRDMGQRIVNSCGPAFFLEGSEDRLLIGRGEAVTLDELACPAQLAAFAVPLGYDDAGRLQCVRATRIAGVGDNLARCRNACWGQDETGSVGECKAGQRAKRALSRERPCSFPSMLYQAFADKPA